MLDIDGLDSCFSSWDSSWKRDNEQIEAELSNSILNPNKKLKKLSRRKKLAIEINYLSLQNKIALK